MGYIYKIINNINDKVYVGQTSESIQQRWYEHKRAANCNEHQDHKTKLHYAMKKYGCDNFIIVQLEEVDNSLLNDREKYWIEYYDSFQSGYNMTLGGEGSRTLDYDKIMTLWDQGFGIKQIAGTVDCSEVQAREILKGYSNYSKQESNRRGARIFKKTVIQYDLSGMFIAEYSSATEASDITRISKSNILAVCNSRQKTAGGYQWRFIGDEPIYGYSTEQDRAVKQFYTDGTLKTIFSSVVQAAQSLNCSVSAIMNACNGKTKSSHGYLWKFLEDDLNIQDLKFKVRVRNRRVSQYTLDDKYITTFDSVNDAASVMGVTYSSIYNACVGISHASCGFIWRFE